jgi:hypothetical protein
MSYPLVKRVPHRLLGEMLRMMLTEQVYFDLTLEEGRTLSRNFTALAYDWRRADFIYLSPVGGDVEFSATVSRDGVHVQTANGRHHLNWDDVTELAERLAVE